MISASREIHSINLYRNGYENALNTFKRIKVEVSSNEDFSDANVLFGTADVEVAAHLGVPVNFPVAEVRRVCRAPDGTVLYLGEITYRGDFIHFEMALTT